MKKSLTLLFVSPLLFATSAFAQHQKLTIDPQASEVAFTLGGNEHATRGTFHVQSGSIDFDPSATKISGSVVVAAGSGKTGNDSRDKKMINTVLEAAHFADVSFVPQSFDGKLSLAGDSTINVTGVFTLHGASHPLTVPMQVHIDGTQCTTKTHFVVPYVSWGLKDPSVFILKVAKEVDIDLTLVGQLSK